MKLYNFKSLFKQRNYASLNKLYFFGLLLFLSFVVNKTYSQSDTYFNQLSIENGLSQSTIYSMVQDDDGFVWIGTRDGLNKFDGYEFQVYRTIAGDSNSLSDNRIFEILKTQNGNLWIGTGNGLNYYDKNSNSFKQYIENSSEEGSLVNNHIYALTQDSKNRIWVGTDGAGICIFDSITNRFAKLKSNEISAELLNSLRIRSLIERNNNEMWIATKGDGIFVYYFDTGKIIQFTEQNAPFKLLSNSVRLLYTDSKGKVWIGFDEDGLTCLNPETYESKNFRSGHENSICHNAVRAIFEDKDQNVWIGTRVGLNKYNPATRNFTFYFHDEHTKGTLSNNSIRSIMQDQSGNLWFGTFYGGINIIYGSSQNFRTYIPNAFKNNSLSYEVVSSFAEDASHNIWVGTEGGGINKLDADGIGFDVYLHQSGKNSLSNNNVKALFFDNQDQLWIGTYGGGLNILDTKSGNFQHFVNNPDDNQSIASNNIYSLLIDSKNRCWVGTNLGGLNLFNQQTKKFKRIAPVDNTKANLLGHTINDIIEDSNGNIWFASDLGLVLFDNYSYSRIPCGMNQSDKSTNVLTLAFDKFGALWAGTEGSGLISFEPKTKAIKFYNQENGLISNVVYGIIPDESNNLWVSTNKGLVKFPLGIHYAALASSANEIITYDINDGLQSNEFNRGASFKSNSGRLYFGGLKGFSTFHPEQISQNKTIPPVVITGFYLSNKEVIPKSDGSPLAKPISRTQHINLKHNQSSFSFDFVALNYDKPQKNQYAYMLEGFDEDWIYSGKNHQAVYTNIDPGTYVFRVKASNNDNLWNTSGARVEITILPPFWKTQWAFFIYIVVIILLMFLFRRMIVFRTNQKNLLMNERLEKQRIEEINQMKLRFFTNISHEFRTPLTLISGPLDKLLVTNDIQESEKNYLLALMHKNVTRLQRLINQLMDFRKLENKKMKLGVSEGDLFAFVSEVAQGFEGFCRQRNIDFMFNSLNADMQTAWFDRSVVDNIVFILLSNATKFTPENGSITVIVEQNQKTASITISDTGIGISKEKLNRIFERFYSDDSIKYTKSMSTGIGLSFAQSLVELHKGNIQVESLEGKGTTFKVEIPVNRADFLPEEIKDFNEQNIVINENVRIEIPSIVTESEENDAMEQLLIVEDNHELRLFIKSHFKSRYKIFEAENGKEALKIAKRELPDLIISDVMMPIMDGIELCKSVKDNLITSHIPVILLTAKTNIEHKIEGTTSGADCYIEKPFNIPLLEANVANLLNQRKKLQEHFSGQISGESAEALLNKTEDEFIQKVSDLILEKKNDPNLTVEYLGEVLGLSRSQLFRKFKALTNTSPNEYIKIVRLKYAVELMVTGELNVNQIAYECGFSSASHFIASFKKYYGKTPKEYSALIISKNKS